MSSVHTLNNIRISVFNKVTLELGLLFKFIDDEISQKHHGIIMKKSSRMKLLLRWFEEVFEIVPPCEKSFVIKFLELRRYGCNG